MWAELYILKFRKILISPLLFFKKQKKQFELIEKR